MKIKIYRHGRIEEIDIDQRSVAVDIVLADNRTARMSFSEGGQLLVRAWGNSPMLLGNWDRQSMSFVVTHERPTSDEFGNPLKDPTP